MKHPILSFRYGIPIYLASWVFFAASLFIIGWYFDGRPAFNALVNATSFALPLLVLGACIWFVVVYTSLENSGVAGFLLHHLTAGIIIVGLWVSLSYQIRITFFDIYPQEGLNWIIPIHWQIFLALFTYDYIVMVYYLIIYYQNFKDKLTHESELKNLVKEAELNALKSQINPHFLFNSLNSVSSLTLSDPENSRDMVVKLSTFLRYSLDQDLKELNSLKNELDNIRLYLQIEKVRFGNRLQLDYNLSGACGNLKIPNLILQPLFENAIKYGVHESLEPVTIRTKCWEEVSRLKISITNNYDSDSVPSKGKGIGLSNIQERLRLIYGRADLMKIVKGNDYFTVHLEFPQSL